MHAAATICLVSNNFPLIVALGHAGEYGSLRFPGEAPGRSTWWSPPTRNIYGYTEKGTVPAEVYDSAAVLQWTWQQMKSAPVDFCVESLGNLFDLFTPYYLWPRDYGGFKLRWVVVMQQLFLFGVIVPALYAIWGVARRFPWSGGVTVLEVFLVSMLLGLFILSTMAIGAPRYRVPFDGLFIILAAGLLRQERSENSQRLLPSAHIPVIAIGCLGCILLLLVPLWVRDPESSARGMIRDSSPPERRTLVPIRSLATAKKRGSPWNAPGNVIFACEAECAEVRAALEPVAFASLLEVSLDCNDAYRIRFYDQERVVAREDLGPEPGLRGARHLPGRTSPKRSEAGLR